MKRLDDWVFDQYWHWLANDAPIHKTEDKLVLYFHLLGCDTIGHAAKPQSKYVKFVLDYLKIVQINMSLFYIH